MKRYIMIATIVLLLTLAGCAQNSPTEKKDKKEVPSDPLYCEKDSDCVCGGIEKESERCFLGNKVYQDKYVDKDKVCPDFCGGLDGKLTVKCVDQKCIQMYECITDMECEPGQRCKDNRCFGKTTGNDGEDGCKSDTDCITGGCSGTICQSRGSEPVFTTCEMKPEYECYKMIDCGCVNGECEWKKTPGFDSCVKEKKTGPV